MRSCLSLVALLLSCLSWADSGVTTDHSTQRLDGSDAPTSDWTAALPADDDATDPPLLRRLLPTQIPDLRLTRSAWALPSNTVRAIPTTLGHRRIHRIQHRGDDEPPPR